MKVIQFQEYCIDVLNLLESNSLAVRFLSHRVLNLWTEEAMESTQLFDLESSW